MRAASTSRSRRSSGATGGRPGRRGAAARSGPPDGALAVGFARPRGALAGLRAAVFLRRELRFTPDFPQR